MITLDKDQVEKLTEDVRILRGLTSPRHTTPLMAALWSRGDYLGTTNGEHVLLIKTPISLPHPIHAGRFYDALKHAGGGKVGIAFHGKGMKITHGKGCEKLPYILNQREVPDLPAPHKRRTKISISLRELSYLARAVSSDTSRYALNGILLDGENRKMVASDGKRLYLHSLRTEKKFKPVILHVGAAKALTAILKRHNREGTTVRSLGISDKNSWLSFQVADMILFTRAIEGKFPDWKAVLPKVFNWTVAFKADQLRETLKACSKFLKSEIRNRGSAPMPYTDKYFVTVRWDKRESQFCICAQGRNSHKKNHKEYPIRPIRIDGDMRGIHLMTMNPDYILDAMWNSRVTVMQGTNQSKPVAIDGVSVSMPLDGMSRGSEGQQLIDRLTKQLGPPKIRWSKPEPLDEKAPPRQPKPPRVSRQKPKPKRLPPPPPRKPRAKKPAAKPRQDPMRLRVRKAALASKSAPKPKRAKPKKRLRDHEIPAIFPFF